MLAEAEYKILSECCKEFGISPKALRALLSVERDVFYNNSSQKSKTVQEMQKVMEFWAKEWKKECEDS
jgi:hypothetical protein